MSYISRLAPFRRFLPPIFGQEPAARLIRQTARHEWRLIAINITSSLIDAFSEGATLATIFFAIDVLSATPETSNQWINNPLLSRLPLVAGWLSTLSTEALYLSLLALAVLLQAVQSLSRYISLVSVGYFAARCKTTVTARIHKQILDFSFPYASSYKIGRLTTFSGKGPDAIRTEIEAMSEIILGISLISVYLMVLWRISAWLLFAVAAIAAFVGLMQRLLLPRIRIGSKKLITTQSLIASRITEDYQALRLLHTSGQLMTAQRRLKSMMVDLECQMRSQVRHLSAIGPFTSFLPVLAISIIASLSLLFMGSGNGVILPSLVTFIVALQRLNSRLSGLAASLNRMADNSGTVDLLNHVLSSTGKKFLRIGGQEFSKLKRSIVLSSVSLCYQSSSREALSNISLTIPRGCTVALVGPSGAGKSSVADLLCGLYEPTHGEILIDDTPLNQINLSSWQQHLGVVSQDTFLFNATIADNIAFGTPSATQNLIEEACRVAQASAFIEDLPDGYHTLVGERGYRLSGGQRQRLSLARAILRKPELLILDEATSALDSQSERLVQQAIEGFEDDQTILVIAHRLSTIVNADEIIVLEAGKICERGTHAQLLSANGIYSNLWLRQADSQL